MPAGRPPKPDSERKRLNAGRAAVALRLAGASYSEVADTLGLDDHVAARDLIELDLAKRGDDTDARDRLRLEEEARILRILRGMWNKAIDPENPEHLPAARVALALIDRHARLMGLDMPTELVVYTPTTGELDAWVQKVIMGQIEADTDVEEPDVLAVAAITG